MSTLSLYNQVKDNLEKLKLYEMSNYLSTFLDATREKEITLLDGLLTLTQKEIQFRDVRAEKINITISNFPFIRTIDDFDFSFQPGINKNLINDLCSLRFLENKENIIFVGSSGVGKTHLATAIGIEACKRRVSTYFIHCQTLMNKLLKASEENRLDAVIKQYARCKLLIIDEIGYLPLSKEGANLFFQLIAKRYEKTSTIITTNQTFSKWGEVFSDAILANAILDRLLHHSTIIKITGPSYRAKDKIDQFRTGKDYDVGVNK
jgi:DNA replication protein DnaC